MQTITLHRTELILENNVMQCNNHRSNGTVTASHKMLTLQALWTWSSLHATTAWAEERLLGALRQSVPQSGCVHLHINRRSQEAGATSRKIKGQHD